MFGTPSHGWVGVDLGAGAVKVAQLRRRGQRLELSAAAAAPRSHAPASPRDGVARDVRAATALAGRTVGRSAAAVLSMGSCLVEPHDPERATREGEVADVWGDRPEAVYELSAAASLVEATVEGVAAVGLECEAIDGAPLTIARALQLSPGYRPDCLLGALDWGESSATFVAARGGVACYARRLAGDGWAATRAAIAESLALSPSEADAALARFGAGNASPSAESKLIASALRDAVRPTLTDLARTFSHLSGKLKTRPPERVFLMGAAALAPGVAEAASERIGAPVEQWTASGITRGRETPAFPDCLLASAIALSALAWEATS